MLNNKLDASRQIAKQLRPSEEAIDGSIVQHAKLIISILEGRQKMGVAAQVGHDAILSATAGLAALTTARDHAVTCHRQLASARDDLGLSPVAVGCTTVGCFPAEEGPNGQLRVVPSKVA